MRFFEWIARRKRWRQIERALPEAIDLMILVMRAGLDFQVALKHYIDKGPAGPLRTEFQNVFKEIQLGTSRVDALRNLCMRTPEPGLKETSRVLIQGLELGASLTPLLQVQTEALRRRQALRAEAAAARTPLKLLFPLMVFIFPTIFIILLGPLMLSMNSGGRP
jgi:tight adherence protein C